MWDSRSCIILSGNTKHAMNCLPANLSFVTKLIPVGLDFAAGARERNRPCLSSTCSIRTCLLALISHIPCWTWIIILQSTRMIVREYIIFSQELLFPKSYSFVATRSLCLSHARQGFSLRAVDRFPLKIGSGEKHWLLCSQDSYIQLCPLVRIIKADGVKAL